MSKMFKSKEFTNKEYKTGDAAGLKKFTGSKWFNTKAYQTQDYGTKRFSPAGQFATEADKEARTSTASGMDRTAATKAFAGAGTNTLPPRDFPTDPSASPVPSGSPAATKCSNRSKSTAMPTPPCGMFTEESPSEPDLGALRVLLGQGQPLSLALPRHPRAHPRNPHPHENSFPLRHVWRRSRRAALRQLCLDGEIPHRPQPGKVPKSDQRAAGPGVQGPDRPRHAQGWRFHRVGPPGRCDDDRENRREDRALGDISAWRPFSPSAWVWATATVGASARGVMPRLPIRFSTAGRRSTTWRFRLRASISATTWFRNGRPKRAEPLAPALSQPSLPIVSVGQQVSASSARAISSGVTGCRCT